MRLLAPVQYVMLPGSTKYDTPCAHRSSQSYVKSHWEKKSEATYRQLTELKAEIKRVGEIVRVMGRLLCNGEVRSLPELKEKVYPKVQTARKVAVMYVGDTAWAERKVLSPG